MEKSGYAIGQTKISNYFDFLNEIQILSGRYQQLQDAFLNIKNNLEKHNASASSALAVENNSSLLDILLKSAEKNTGRIKNGYRHDDTMKMFMCYVKMLGGRLLYETLHANFSTSIPSPSVINKFIAEKGQRITEGLLRSKEVAQHLRLNGLPLLVCVSEDGTRMVGKICYDPHDNKLIGFSLPLNDDGMPITDLFMARNAAEIEGHFLNKDNSVSTIAYTIMVQPLSETAIPYILTLFGTDNKFNAMDVMQRWNFIKTELRKEGIEVLIFASYGDARLLKGMKIESEIGSKQQAGQR